MKTQRKVITLAVCAVLLAAVVVVGTLAYLTDREKVVNTFTVGDVDITLDETAVTPDGKPISGAERVQENDYHLIPGNSYVKDPTVTVAKGSEESYVRMLVSINKLSELDAIFAPSGADLLALFEGYDSTEWIYYGETEADNTITYEFRYFETVDASQATADIELSPLFEKLKVPGEITGEQLKTIEGMEITVVAHAIQKSSLDSVDDAWASFDVQYGQ